MNKKEKKIQEENQQNNPNSQGQDPAMTTDNESTAAPEQPAKEEKPEEKAAPTAEEKIIALEKQLSESTDKYLRLFSEFDNFRKRTIRERLELSNTASAGVITALLPVLDDLERAGKMASGKKDDNHLEGIQLIYNKFKNILFQKGVEEIKTIGETFNTDFHEAITHIPAQDESQKGRIVDEVQKGYTLNSKVIRFARVVVAN